MTTDATEPPKPQEPDWRELVKPLFMEMYRRGIKDVRLVRDGGKCQMTMTLDIDPPPGVLIVDESDDDDDFDDDDFDGFDDGPGDGPLDYLERTAEK